MKIQKPTKYDPHWYLHITDNIFVHTINDWSQLYGKYNWYTFHFIHIYFEDDVMTSGYEFEAVLLGLGFRLRWNHSFNESKVGKVVKDLELE